jgi:NAD(P)-dependent dehydrogenase (short-subunit alcohol dehydrogenase family)
MEAGAPSADTTLLPAKGRVVLLTGASRGLGAAIARRLFAEGFTLALGVRDPARTATTLKLATEQCSVHPFDATEPRAGEALATATIKQHGRLDVLINNAGVLKPFGFADADEAALDAMLTVNVKAPFRLIRAALPHLKAAGHGRIINIASTDAKRYREGAPLGYAMSKHALLALSHAAKFEAWQDGVRVTALCPGAIETDLISGLPGVTPSAGRLKPETVAEMVVLLLRLPNTATISELVMNTRLEASL